MRRTELFQSIRAIFSFVACAILATTVFAEESQDAAKKTGNATSEGSTKQQEDAAPSTFLLRYDFSQGQFVHYRVRHATTMHIVYGEFKQTTKHQSKSSKHYRVVSVGKDGNAIVEPMLDHVIMSAQSDDDEPIVFDSANGLDDCPQIFRHIMSTVGHPSTTMKFSSMGKLISLNSSKSGKKSRRICSSGATSPGINKPNAQEQVDPHRNFLIPLPKEAIKVGHRWSETSNVCVTVGKGLRKQIALRKGYELASVDDGIATIKTKISILAPLRDPSIRTQLIQKTPRGVVKFDIEKGQIISRATSLDNLVIGAIGPKSSLHTISQRTEEMVDKAKQEVSLRD